MKDRKLEWQILFCEEKDKFCNLPDFIEDLPVEGQVKTLKFLELLRSAGPQLKRPYSDILSDGVHELRFRLGKKYIRILYFFVYRDYVVLFRGINKKTDRTPDKYIRKAARYKEELMNKYDRKDIEERLNAPI